jgi:hypothetical protein
MYIKNKTSEVSVSRSISIISQRLIEAGAMSISQDYGEDKKIKALFFTMLVNGSTTLFRLPVKVNELFEIMKKNCKTKTYHRGYEGVIERLKAQAERTAWKIIVDWVEVQLTMIQTEQANPFEIFLPYAYNQVQGKTFYELVSDNPQNTVKLLTN